MNNVISLEFLDKKKFPPGKWLNEPDLCHWNYDNVSCLTVRDMSLGTWKGYVGVNKQHSFYGKTLESLSKIDEAVTIYLAVYGGICSAGKIPLKYKKYGSTLWWLGIETSFGNDYMPLLKLDAVNTDMVKVVSSQTYKDFSFIRRETKALAKCLIEVT
jgi:hypothetical protein